MVTGRNGAYLVSNARGVLICHAQGAFYAIDKPCPHAQASLEHGRLRCTVIACPLHRMLFDLRTGASKSVLTSNPLVTFQTRVHDGRVEVCLDASPAEDET